VCLMRGYGSSPGVWPGAFGFMARQDSERDRSRGGQYLVGTGRVLRDAEILYCTVHTNFNGEVLGD
jgi:hypothetical protein